MQQSSGAAVAQQAARQCLNFELQGEGSSRRGSLRIEMLYMATRNLKKMTDLGSGLMETMFTHNKVYKL